MKIARYLNISVCLVTNGSTLDGSQSSIQPKTKSFKSHNIKHMGHNDYCTAYYHRHFVDYMMRVQGSLSAIGQAAITRAN